MRHAESVKIAAGPIAAPDNPLKTVHVPPTVLHAVEMQPSRQPAAAKGPASTTTGELLVDAIKRIRIRKVGRLDNMFILTALDISSSWINPCVYKVSSDQNIEYCTNKCF
eukprot:GFUD01104055.1.p1 GENE.GFUD01104055.1~~GFUD01104055.1.p1  ORF type:complete len:110 (+),score=21.16 GFUD01104055.1:325-654(+)